MWGSVLLQDPDGTIDALENASLWTRNTTFGASLSTRDIDSVLLYVYMEVYRNEN